MFTFASFHISLLICPYEYTYHFNVTNNCISTFYILRFSAKIYTKVQYTLTLAYMYIICIYSISFSWTTTIELKNGNFSIVTPSQNIPIQIDYIDFGYFWHAVLLWYNHIQIVRLVNTIKKEFFFLVFLAFLRQKIFPLFNFKCYTRNSPFLKVVLFIFSCKTSLFLFSLLFASSAFCWSCHHFSISLNSILFLFSFGFYVFVLHLAWAWFYLCCSLYANQIYGILMSFKNQRRKSEIS